MTLCKKHVFHGTMVPLHVFSSSEIVGFHVFSKFVAIHVPEGEHISCVERDAVAVDFPDGFEVDDVGTMNAHEVRGRQSVFDFLHRQQCHDGFLFVQEVEAKIGAHGLDVADFGDVEADDLVVRLEINDVFLEFGLFRGKGRRSGGSGMRVLFLLLLILFFREFHQAFHLAGSVHELVHAKRFQQVVHSIHLETLHGKLRVRRREDNQRR